MSVPSTDPIPVATIGNLQPLSYIALKHLVRQGSLQLSVLARLVPLTSAAAEDTCRLLERVHLLEVEPPLRQIGPATRVRATASGRQFVERPRKA